jgi:RNA polymerase sigma-70 factor (ECF subfamily)
VSRPEAEQGYLDLIERNQGRISRLSRAWSRSTPDFEDLRSEILFQLWRSWPSFDGRSSEDTWLFRVALNVAFQFGRKARRQRDRIERLERESGPEPHEPPPSAHLEERERLECLSRAVSSLAPGDRALVALWLEELPYQQMAEVTGLSENQIGVRLHRIKKKLAERVAEEGRVHERR